MGDVEKGVEAVGLTCYEDLEEKYNGSMDQLEAHRVSVHTWQVISTRNGSPTIHTVNVSEGTCTCPDNKFNRDEGQPCAHLAYAIAYCDTSTEAIAFEDVAQLYSMAANLVSEAQDAHAVWLDATDEGTASPTQSTESGSPSPSDGSGSESDVAAEEAADRLQEAFDSVIDDMQVTTSAGKVWFQTGRDTPDEWPYPGGDETFSVVTGPDMVSFVHDGSAEWADGPHPLYNDKPGEWWKNALDPSDVDAYVEEVLS